MAEEAGAGAGHDAGFGRRAGRGRRGRRFGGTEGPGNADEGERGRGGRGGRGGRRGRRGGDKDKEPWIPVTKLGRLVQAKKIRTLEDIYLHSLSIKEYQIVDYFLGEGLKDEVMKITPVQKQTAAGQRTKFKAWVIVGDSNGHIGLGVKCAKEVAGAIRGAMIDAKLNVIPVRRGYWGLKFGSPHTVPCKLTGKCGSVRTRLVPAPRGTGLVAGKVAKKVLTKAGIIDCYTQTKGATKTLGNFVYATYHALVAAYNYLTPDLWPQTALVQSPMQAHSEFLASTKKASFVKSEKPERRGYGGAGRAEQFAAAAAPAPAAEAAPAPAH